MTTIAETLQALKEEFASLPDCFARYAYLTELSALLAPPPEVRRAEYSYRGCQSQVWLCARADAGVCRLAADSDTLIIRGVLALFRELLEGQPHRRSGRSPAGNPPAVVSNRFPIPFLTF